MAITPLMPVYPRCDVRPVKGEGVYLIGERGERYLDFASGIAVNLLGHSHPHLIGAIQRQAETLMHVSNLYGSPQGESLAQRLIDLTFADTVFFTNSGAEAVECAIKTARRYHHVKGNAHKHELITFSNAFHGRTMATISAGSGLRCVGSRWNQRLATSRLAGFGVSKMTMPPGARARRLESNSATMTRNGRCSMMWKPVTAPRLPSPASVR